LSAVAVGTGAARDTSTIVIGIHDGHKASVAMVRDGRVEFALTEERITRIKIKETLRKIHWAALWRWRVTARKQRTSRLMAVT